jgi:putative peptidoglycan lipid II flippase
MNLRSALLKLPFGNRMKARFSAHVLSTFAITVIQQVVGLGRQILIAAYFGLSREYDQYLVVYAVATIVVFSLSPVFDTIAVTRLVKIREIEGDTAFWRNSNRLLLQSLLGGVLFAVALNVVLHLLISVIAAGFNQAERDSVKQLALYFTLWVVIIIPYYAVSVHLKALWRFHWAFGAETVAIIVSAAALWLRHDSIECLPEAYTVGYLAAFIMLLARRGIHFSEGKGCSVELLGGMANQHLANQFGSMTGLVDRYYQSYLEAGGISALGYAGQIVNNLSSLLTFREIYVVPLTTEAGRSERLERILQGVVLISIPSVFFVAEFANLIASVLFQRGNFTPEAAALTGDVMRIMAWSLVISSILAPLARLFQILNRISYSHVLYLVSLIGTAIFQYLLVFRFGWGVYGVAWAGLANSAVVTLVVIGLVRRCGVAINWRPVFANALFAAALAGVAAAISWPLIAGFSAVVALALGGVVFGLIVGMGYFLARARLRLIIG